MAGEGTAEDEMVGWHHRLDGHEFEQAPGVADGQGRVTLLLQLWRKLHMHAPNRYED